MPIGEISRSANGVYVDVEWKIDRFFTLSKENGKCYCSPDFFFGGQKWHLRMYPNGWSKFETSGHVDVRLWKDISGPSIRQEFSLSLKTVKGKMDYVTQCTKTFEGWENSHLFRRFLTRSELSKRRSELVPDGVLTVVCTLKRTPCTGGASNTASTTAECCHCKGELDAENLFPHQKKCMHRIIKCPDCLEVVVLQKWLDEHECQTERPEAGTHTEPLHLMQHVDVVPALRLLVQQNTGKDLEQNSKKACMEASTQTVQEKSGKGHKENSGKICIEASTQTAEKSYERIKEKSRNACVDASIQTEEQNVSLMGLPEECELGIDVKKILEEERGVDVTFELETSSGKTEFFAHQLILALRSTYFADLFYAQGRNKGRQIVPLKGINTKAFEQMIRYCYDYKPCLKTTEDAWTLYKVAFEFKIMSLRNLCHTFFRHTKIEPLNVFRILKISEQIKDRRLKDTCYMILQEKTREVIETHELRDVTPYMVYTILDLPKLSLNSEYELIRWLFDWAKLKYKDENSFSENAREYLQKFLKEMNFLALTSQEFALLCRDNEDFFNNDEIANVSLNIVFPGTRDMPDWYDKDLKCRIYTGSN